MPMLAGGPPYRAATIHTGEGTAVARGLDAAFARARLEDVIRAIAEDALDPGHTDSPTWRDDAVFEGDLRAIALEIAESANDQLIERLTDLLDGAPPRLVARLTAGPRFLDLW